MTQCPWTFGEFCFRFLLAVLLLASALYFARNIDTSLRNGRGYPQEGMDTRLTVTPCWQWSTQHPEVAYNRCQNQFLGGEK